MSSAQGIGDGFGFFFQYVQTYPKPKWYGRGDVRFKDARYNHEGPHRHRRRRGIGRSSEGSTQGAVLTCPPDGMLRRMRHWSKCRQSRRTTGKLGCIGPAYFYAIKEHHGRL